MLAAPLAIMDLDLSDGLRALSLADGFKGACLVFWWKDRPLGRTVLAAGQFPVPAPTLACLAASAIAAAVTKTQEPDGRSPGREALAAPDPALFGCSLADLLAPPPECRDAVEACARTSVVVCTRGRPLDAAICVENLSRLSPAPLEVIVVDNAHAGEPQVSQAMVGASRIVRQRGGGLSAARNAGIAAARGDFIAFTDDDAVVRPGWLVRLLEPFEDPRTGCVTGLVLPSELATDAQVTFEFELGGFNCRFQRSVYNEAFLQETQPVGAPVWEIGAGASMAFRRTALEASGPFDTRLGAGASGCSEDSEMWYRLLSGGWTCVYEPMAVAFHRHRVTWPELERQATSYMRGHVAALMIQFRKHRHSGNLRRAFYYLPRGHLRLMLAALLAGNASRLKLAAREALGIVQGFSPRYWAGEKPKALHERSGDGR